MKILLTVSYVGTAYQGYQLQNDKPTVALELNRAVRRVFGFECLVTGCSRTDSGVHTLGYRVSVEPASAENKITVPTDKIPAAMNTVLPRDISVLSAMEVDDGFHPRYSVVKKEYVYRIRASVVRDPFLADKVYEYGKSIDTLSVENMKMAAERFIGTHNFDAFMASGSSVTDTRRTVYESYITVCGDIIEYHVAADGFLYNMVRIMVGTLLQVGRGKLAPSDITRIIESKNRALAGSTARAEGLYLKKVYYDFDMNK